MITYRPEPALGRPRLAFIARYADRIAAEGRWRTFARISSDSGHACSSTLHAEALGSTYGSVWRYFFAYNPGYS